MIQRLREWFEEHKNRSWLLVGFVLVGILCFEAGILQGKAGKQEPLVLSVPAAPQEQLTAKESVASEGNILTPLPGVEPVVAPITTDKAACAFVGSKNSDKYHLPSCAVAKRIKLENRVCFASKEDAERRGYIASCVE